MRGRAIVTTQEVSAGSTLDTSVIRCASATIPEVRQYEEYSGLTEESAKSIVQDAVSTGHIFRTNGSNVTDFPSYYGLRFIATADEDRGFFHASNSRKVRAACLKLYTLGYGKKDTDVNAPKREKRASDTSGQTKIFITVQDDMDAMMEDATMQVLLFCQKRAASKVVKAQNEITGKIDSLMKNLSPDQQAAFFAAIAAMQIASK